MLRAEVLAELGVDLLRKVVQLPGDFLDFEVGDAFCQSLLWGSAWFEGLLFCVLIFLEEIGEQFAMVIKSGGGVKGILGCKFPKIHPSSL